MAGNDTSLRSSLMSEEQSLSNPSPKRDQLKPRQAQNQYFARQRTKLILRSVASSARAGRVSVYAVAIGAEGYGVVEVCRPRTWGCFNFVLVLFFFSSGLFLFLDAANGF